ncbi:carboxynorspermidine decarboxylase [bacterium]|jgi:carboxynorspermidine decarboxylase|nr:carboxynorspermidine decarboxylase [bacterium]
MLYDAIPTPCFIIEEDSIRSNAAILESVRRRTGCHILLALKAFSTYPVFPMLAPSLDGVTCTSVHEARLGNEEFGGEIHTYSPAYTESGILDVLRYSSHITFNTPQQIKRFQSTIKEWHHEKSFGLRINPEHSEVDVAMYDPCAPFSRLGTTISNFDPDCLAYVDGFLAHMLCEQSAEALDRSVAAIESKFGPYLSSLKWLNLGGGHHITSNGYNIDLLCSIIERLQTSYDLQVILEPGEAVVAESGVLVAEVLDVMHNDMDIAIVGTSASTHMPDVLEMPYRPDITGAAKPNVKSHTYRIGGMTCLAGDVIGDYSFDRPLEIGQRLIFEDMAMYTMVKTTTFNGIELPAIAIHYSDGRIECIRQFDYSDFKSRLGPVNGKKQHIMAQEQYEKTSVG